MMLPPNPGKYAETSDRLFWELVTLVRVSDEDAAACSLRLAKYLMAHGGWYKLSDTLTYLAKGVAINSIVGELPDQMDEAAARWRCAECGEPMTLTTQKRLYCAKCDQTRELPI